MRCKPLNQERRVSVEAIFLIVTALKAQLEYFLQLGLFWRLAYQKLEYLITSACTVGLYYYQVRN